ncbi:MAG TPA: hypothetical protein VF228_21215 [Iamia sp.]
MSPPDTPRRRRRATTAAVALALALAACQPITVTDEGWTSSASRAVDPTTITSSRGAAGQGIDIRMRDCRLVQLRVQGVEQDITLNPHAHVTDANGKVLYSSHDFPDPPQVRPPGSFHNPNGSDGAYHIVVPVGGARAPLTIETWCDNYTPGSHGLYPRWSFPTCRTSTRRCAASTPGDGEWQLEA